jgi:hypothetical protein
MIPVEQSPQNSTYSLTIFGHLPHPSEVLTQIFDFKLQDEGREVLYRLSSFFMTSKTEFRWSCDSFLPA